MFLSSVLSYTPYGLITAFTPGPNNIVALYSIGQYGWKRGKNILFGIAAGFFCVMALCALFCYELARYAPTAAGALKYAGAAYIVYLAVHIAVSKSEDSEVRQMSFWKGFLLEFVNVKIILYAITIYTGYVLPYELSMGSLLCHAVWITVIGMAGTFTWAVAGSAFQTFLKRHDRPFRMAMVLILLWCALSMAFDL
ncbi:LysE family transporter [Oscillibacter sp. MSJ-2]|uniref:LysE family transporter n=1 Tax=Dysosmobacter acutus TaxID=2841504 RepID=A0ABS6FBB2_9FIRM|nr:LysE family transporter [Dysosmobacter acutus]MBU5627556.1 LysE family transporter [Dysosmobacter acutus]